VQLQLKKDRADRENMEAKLFELKQKSALVTRLFEKLTPNAATIFSQF
jgi:hypothetical protein